MAAGGIFYTVKSRVAHAAHPIASPGVVEPGLAKVSAWLRGAAIAMSAPDCARAAFERIGAQVAELQALALPEVDMLALKQAGLVADMIKTVKVIKTGELTAKVVPHRGGYGLIWMA